MRNTAIALKTSENGLNTLLQVLQTLIIRFRTYNFRKKLQTSQDIYSGRFFDYGIFPGKDVIL